MIKFTPESWQTGQYNVITREGKTVHRLRKTTTGFAGIIDGYHYAYACNGCLIGEYGKHEYDLFLKPKKRTYLSQAMEVVRDLLQSWYWV